MTNGNLSVVKFSVVPVASCITLAGDQCHIEAHFQPDCASWAKLPALLRMLGEDRSSVLPENCLGVSLGLTASTSLLL
jgi:hypothetical protein